MKMKSFFIALIKILALSINDNSIIAANATATPFHHPAFIVSSLNHRCSRLRRYNGIDRLSFCRSRVDSAIRMPIPLHLRQQLSSAPSTMPMTMNPMTDDDLIALPFDEYISSISSTVSPKAFPTPRTPNDCESIDNNHKSLMQLRLCVVRNQDYVFPLIQHEDDAETDLYLDPRHMGKEVRYSDVMDWSSEITTNISRVNVEEEVNPPSPKSYYYGVGWYGQRPVPSLGGGPGYGAEATEVWSIDNETLERLKEDGVQIPIIDVGIAHGEKARGGALF